MATAHELINPGKTKALRATHLQIVVRWCRSCLARKEAEINASIAAIHRQPEAHVS